MSIEAMKQALEALNKSHPYSNSDKDLDAHSEVIVTLRSAIAEAEKQEPVANDRTMTVVYRNVTPDDARSLMSHPMAVWFGWCHAPYERDHARSLLDMAAAPSREWIGLTDEEIEDLYFDGFSMSQLHEFARAIEVKLKEKNDDK